METIVFAAFLAAPAPAAECRWEAFGIAPAPVVMPAATVRVAPAPVAPAVVYSQPVTFYAPPAYGYRSGPVRQPAQPLFRRPAFFTRGGSCGPGG